MAKKTDKQRVHAALARLGEATTAKISSKAGVLHPSTRRYLNELRAEGIAARGNTHGTWVLVSTVDPKPEPEPPMAAPEQSVGAEVIAELDARPVLSNYKLECEGDVVYAVAVDADDAYKQLIDAMVQGDADALPRALVTITPVEGELPEDADVLTPYDPDVQYQETGDEPLSQMDSDDAPVEEIQ